MRGVGSTQVDPFSAVSAGVAALYGPLHGGANEQVLRMLDEIGDVKNVPAFIEGVKNHERLLMGFGHRVYKNYDPRAKLIKRVADDVFAQTGVDPKLEIALELERIALEDDYFVSRKLYPNVDFYSGIIYRAMGYPTDYFTVLFALGRLPGWLAQWEEMLSDPEQKIARPRQIYTGLRRARVRPAREPLGLPAELDLALVAGGGGGVLVRDLPGAVGVLAQHPREPVVHRAQLGAVGRNRREGRERADCGHVLAGLRADVVEPHRHDLVVGQRAEPLGHHPAQRVLPVVRPPLPEIERCGRRRRRGPGTPPRPSPARPPRMPRASLPWPLRLPGEPKLSGERLALVRLERARERGQRRLELGGPPRADDDRDALVREQPRERERRRVAAPLELFERVVDARRSRRCSYGPGRSVIREPSGTGSSRRYFPVSQPPQSGLNAWNQRPCSAQSGSTSGLDLAVEERVGVLDGGEGADLERLGELRAVDVAQPVGADLPGGDELVEDARELGRRDVVVPGVREIEIDALDAEPREARVDLAPHPRRREAVILALVHRVEGLRREPQTLRAAASGSTRR